MALRKTSITISKIMEAEFDRNTFNPSRSDRISQVFQRYLMLIKTEAASVADLSTDPYLVYVIGEYSEVYPMPAIRLHQVVQTVSQERMLDGEDLPENLNELIERLQGLSPIQELALIENIEAGL